MQGLELSQGVVRQLWAQQARTFVAIGMVGLSIALFAQSFFQEQSERTRYSTALWSFMGFGAMVLIGAVARTLVGNRGVALSQPVTPSIDRVPVRSEPASSSSVDAPSFGPAAPTPTETASSFEQWIMEKVSIGMYDSFLKDYCSMDEEKALQILAARPPLESLKLGAFSVLHVHLKGQEEPVVLVAFNIASMAAFRGHFKLLGWFIRQGMVKAAQVDLRGWTLGHYACMHPDAKQRLGKLIELGIPVDKPNQKGITARQFANAVSNKSTPENVRIQLDGVEISPAEYRQRFGIEYSVQNRWSTESLLYITISDYKPSTDPHKVYLAKKYERHLQLVKDGHLNIAIRTITDGPLAGQFDAVAARDIAAGEIVTEYIGDVVGVDTHMTSFVMFEPGGTNNMAFPHDPRLVISPMVTGSLAKYVNHGFPNCIMNETHHEGLPVTLLLAITDIKKGDSLYFDYGRKRYWDALGLQELELNKTEITQFLDQTGQLQDVPACFGFIQDDNVVIGCYKHSNRLTIPIPINDRALSSLTIAQGNMYRLRYLLDRIDLIKDRLANTPSHILNDESYGRMLRPGAGNGAQTDHGCPSAGSSMSS